MAFFQENMIASMFVIGLALLVIEILVLGFSTFVLFFMGLAAIATGLLFFVGIVPESALNALLSTAILSGFFAGVLWQPLKKMQQETDDTKAQSDLIGLQFELTEELLPGKQHLHKYSGIEWQLKSSVMIPIGAKVKVTAVEVGIMHVEPLNQSRANVD